MEVSVTGLHLIILHYVFWKTKQWISLFILDKQKQENNDNLH